MQLLSHPFLHELQSSLAGTVPTEPVSLHGEWSSQVRRVNQNEAMVASGAEPVVEVMDTRWTGALACRIPVGCVAFLVTPGSLSWAKSSPASLELRVELSVHAYARHMRDRATFAADVGGARLPSVPVRSTGNAVRDVVLEAAGHTTGRLACLARLDDATVYIYLLPGALLKVGRKRLWHLRGELAASLPVAVRALLTHGRNGRIQPGAASSRPPHRERIDDEVS